METYIGTILLFAFNYEPIGFMLCDGRALNIQEYSALYALIGITYGGNGTSTFMLPNLNGASPLPAMKYYIATEGMFPPRQ